MSIVVKPATFGTWIRDGVRWRWRALVKRLRARLGIPEKQWARVVMDRVTDDFVRGLNYSSLKVLEIGGDKWRDFGFASYRTVSYPDYDVCERALETEAFDLVIAEQVFEHLLWPYRAVRNVRAMLRPGGIFVITTPFLVCVHNYPVDCSRWTELGLKHLLVEGGFERSAVTTGSWGNRSCARANLDRFPTWIPGLHSLKNQPDFPVVVWAFARREG